MSQIKNNNSIFSEFTRQYNVHTSPYTYISIPIEPECSEMHNLEERKIIMRDIPKEKHSR